jgi:hypothetical protein
VTPKGVAVYPWLNTPDTKFSPEGDYKVTLKLSAEEAEPLIQKVTKITDDFFDEVVSKDPKAKNLKINYPFDEEMDDQGNSTGNYLFKFKQKAQITSKEGKNYNMNVALFDAKRNPTTVQVGGGSEIKIAATVWPYVMQSSKTVGLSLKPTAVQIIKLSSVGSAHASSMFQNEEGFTAEASPSAPEFESSDASDF